MQSLAPVINHLRRPAISQVYESNADSQNLGRLVEAAIRVVICRERLLPTLDLSFLNLSILPKIDNLSHINMVILSHNNLTSIDEIQTLDHLSRVIACSNELSTLPSMQSLTSLVNLDVAENKLSSLTSLRMATSLRVLNLSNNDLHSITPLHTLSELVELDIGLNRMSSLKGIESLSSLTKLDVGLNNIRSTHRLGPLHGLKFLNLMYNKLTSLENIGLLNSLDELILSCNRLRTVTELSGLTSLKNLSLDGNKLYSTEGLDSLIGLRQLSLARNRLTSCNHLETLTSLEILNLTNNKLESLAHLGSLVMLRELSVHDNRHLNQLPLAILPRITSLDVSNTAIVNVSVRQYLFACQAVRDQTPQELELLLVHWNFLAQNEPREVHALNHLLNFEKRERDILATWLARLSQTSEFKHRPAKIASIVCSMMKNLKEGEEFKAIFLEEVDINNEDCGDRSAMLLNILYVLWLINKMPANTPLREKIALFSGCAKTLVLREAVDEAIRQKENATKLRLRESVEIQLFCELMLKEELNLVTVSGEMLYPEIGNCPWLDFEGFKLAVNDAWIDKAASLKPVQKLALKDAQLAARWRELDAKIGKLHRSMERQKRKLSTEEYRLHAKQLMFAREKGIQVLTKEWILQNSP